MWENPGKTLEKSRKTPGKPGKTWENPGKTRENRGKTQGKPRTIKAILLQIKDHIIKTVF